MRFEAFSLLNANGWGQHILVERTFDEMVERAAKVLHAELCGCPMPMKADVSYTDAARKALSAALSEKQQS